MLLYSKMIQEVHLQKGMFGLHLPSLCFRKKSRTLSSSTTLPSAAKGRRC